MRFRHLTLAVSVAISFGSTASADGKYLVRNGDSGGSGFASCNWPSDRPFAVFSGLKDGESLIGRRGPSVEFGHVGLSVTNETNLLAPGTDIDEYSQRNAGHSYLVTAQPEAAALCEKLASGEPSREDIERFKTFIAEDAYWVSVLPDHRIPILDGMWDYTISQFSEKFYDDSWPTAEMAYFSAKHVTFMNEVDFKKMLKRKPLTSWVARSAYLEVTDVQGVDTSNASAEFRYTPYAQAKTCDYYGFVFAAYDDMGGFVHGLGSIPDNSVVRGCERGDADLEGTVEMDCQNLEMDEITWHNFDYELGKALCPARMSEACAEFPDELYWCGQSG